jgi:hypothetical protein
MAVVGLGRGVGLAIPGKATVGETGAVVAAGAAVPPGCTVGATVGAVVVPQAMTATATAVVSHACQCHFSLTKSSLLSWDFPFQIDLPEHMTLWDAWNYKTAS